MQKKKLISRLSWYGPLEKFHAFITFPGLLIFGIYHYDFQNIIFLSYGLLICIFILYQGQKYWKIKLDKLKNLPVNDSENLKFFKKSKRINRISIIGIPLIFIVQLALDNWEIIPGRLLFFGILANVFCHSRTRQLLPHSIDDRQFIRYDLCYPE